jgi:hypothetical protein
MRAGWRPCPGITLSVKQDNDALQRLMAHVLSSITAPGVPAGAR